MNSIMKKSEPNAKNATVYNLVPYVFFMMG